MIEFRYSFVGFWFSHLKKDLNLGPEIDKSVDRVYGLAPGQPWTNTGCGQLELVLAYVDPTQCSSSRVIPLAAMSNHNPGFELFF